MPIKGQQTRLLPDLQVPDGKSTADVRIINSTSYQRTKTEYLYGNAVRGHEMLNLPTYSFLVTNDTTGSHILFGLGTRKDWWNACSPEVAQHIGDEDGHQPMQISVQHDVRDILDMEYGRTGLRADEISAVIWSHHHFDQRGDISRFSLSTKIIVGPGAISNLSDEAYDDELAGREVVEMQESDFDLPVAGFQAHDAFGDGSFYVLLSPGYTENHLCGLVRVTTNPNTFVFLGGNGAHHVGEFRPSPYFPLPQQIFFKPSTWSCNSMGKLRSPELRARKIMLCTGEFIQNVIHPKHSKTEPFYDTPLEPVVHNHSIANDTLAKVELLDAYDEVLVCITHDMTLMNVLPFYPYSIKDWYRKGYKQQVHWEFLYDFDLEEKPILPVLGRSTLR